MDNIIRLEEDERDVLLMIIEQLESDDTWDKLTARERYVLSHEPGLAHWVERRSLTPKQYERLEAMGNKYLTKQQVQQIKQELVDPTPKQSVVQELFEFTHSFREQEAKQAKQVRRAMERDADPELEAVVDRMLDKQPKPNTTELMRTIRRKVH